MQERVRQEWSGVLSLKSWFGALQAYSYRAREALPLIVSPFTVFIEYCSSIFTTFIPLRKPILKYQKGEKPAVAGLTDTDSYLEGFWEANVTYEHPE